MTLDAADLLARIRSMTHEEMASTLVLLEELEMRKRIALAQMDFLAFIAALDPVYKFGGHLKRLGGLLMQIEQGTKDRIAVSMAPRMGKSTMISVFFPAWYLGKHPDRKIIMASHTSDLAVDMARKVRNLMQTDEYKRIFPGVAISADAKAAGKWNTTKGGEAYACIEPHTPVLTPVGHRPASDLAVGDYVLVGCTRKRVEAVFHSTHCATVRIDGVGFSAHHPIWTANRGWVSAGEVKFSDTLWVENFWDRLKAFVRGGLYGYLEHPDVPALVQHQSAVHQPEERKVGTVWRAWNYLVRAVDGVRQLLRRHGGPAHAGAYRGPNRQRWALQPGELPLGYCIGAGEQSVEQLGGLGSYDCAARAGLGGVSGGHNGPDTARDACGRGSGFAATFAQEFWAYGPPENHGWRTGAVARWAGRSRGRCEPAQARGWIESSLARGRRAAKVVQGILLGVRGPLTLVVEQHPPQPFINYRIEGGDVFYAGGILTHNCGVGGALAGRGADLAIVDDPLSEQDLKAGNTDSLETVYEWFRAGLRTRLQPGGAICVLHTRWHARDIIGRVVKDAAMNPEADQYEVFEFPAILTTPNPEYDPENPDSPSEVQKSLWPEQWTLESLLKTKASMPAWQWNAQYMQNPTAQEAALIKKDDIKWWPKDTPPECSFLVQGWDTAMTTKERSDYSVCQTWGVWTTEDGVDNVILLNSVRRKVEFPELKRIALEQVQEWEPDALIIEAKASGQPLIDELRRSGIYVQGFSPGKGQDKIARVNAITDMFASGQVWFPETHWATEVVDEILAFPSGEHDDHCFAANTAILMADKRERDILNVSEGDFVWTPTGAQRVTAAGCSSPSARVVEVVLSNGSVLRGTANHPVYVSSAQAFVPLGNLQTGDVLCQAKNTSTEGLRTVDTLIAKALPCGAISTENATGLMKRFTAGFGKTITDLYRWAGTSTTKMVTPVTTTYRTWSVSPQLRTASLTAEAWTHGPSTSGNGQQRTASGKQSRLQNTLARGAHPSLNRFRSTGPSSVLISAVTCLTAAARRAKAVLFAGTRLTPRAQRTLVPLNAVPSMPANERLNDTYGGTFLGKFKPTPSSAPSAALNFARAGIAPACVPRSASNAGQTDCSVIAVREIPQPEPVYNLTVEGNPVFYANGVLVHNCDTMTLCLARIRQGGLIRLNSDHEEPDLLPYRRRAAYY